MTRIYVVNTSDRERMRMLWDPALTTEAGVARSGDEVVRLISSTMTVKCRLGLSA